MASVHEVSALYTNFMRNPPPPGEGVCEVCSTFCTGYPRCLRCRQDPQHLSCVVPISMSEALGQLHRALRGYKSGTHPDVRHTFSVQLTAVLWRFLESHETCVAAAAGTGGFELVTTVPSSSRQRDETHPLRTIVGRWTRPTAGRYERLLRRTDHPFPEHTVSLDKFRCVRRLDGEPILLIDDTWTTGGNAQSAAAVLADAGSGPVGLVVIGRHVNPDFRDNADRLGELPGLFDWDRCCRHRP